MPSRATETRRVKRKKKDKDGIRQDENGHNEMSSQRKGKQRAVTIGRRRSPSSPMPALLRVGECFGSSFSPFTKGSRVLLRPSRAKNAGRKKKNSSPHTSIRWRRGGGEKRKKKEKRAWRMHIGPLCPFAFLSSSFSPPPQ